MLSLYYSYMGKRYIGYSRSSTLRQSTDGMSLEIQEEQLKKYCSIYGITLVKIFTDVKTGKNLDRDGLKSALDALKSPDIDGVLIAKLDRISRNPKDLLTLIDDHFGDKDLVSVGEKLDTSTPHGKFALTLMGSVACLEREVLVERVKGAMAHLKEQGKRCGGRAVSYGKSVKPDGTLVPNAYEMRVIRKARRLRAQGLSYNKVACALEAQGHLARNGKRFYAQQIKNMAG